MITLFAKSSIFHVTLFSLGSAATDDDFMHVHIV